MRSTSKIKNGKQDTLFLSLHASSVYSAIDFIDENLGDALSLKIVAAHACYSPFHFHRIFASVTGESLNAYITRKRIEKTAALLIHRPDVPILELAMRYGFTSNAAFTRTFRKFYGVSPTAFRRKCPDKYSKIFRAKSKNGQVSLDFIKDICITDKGTEQLRQNARISVRRLPPMEILALSHIGVNGMENTFDMLIDWVKGKGPGHDDFKMIRVFHDSFRITGADKIRMSACVLLNKQTETDGGIQRRILQGGKFVTGHFKITMTEYPRAWAGLFLWMNEQGFKYAERECFEIIHNDFRAHPESKIITDLYIPVVKQ